MARISQTRFANLKKLFVIALGEEDGEYIAIVDSITDNKTARVHDLLLKRLLPKMNKLIRSKARQERLLPVPRRIVLRGQNGDRSLTHSEIQKVRDSLMATVVPKGKLGM